jgi:hypothetical protein
MSNNYTWMFKSKLCLPAIFIDAADASHSKSRAIS